MTKPTIQDIARLSGVSTATVSRAIHEPRLLLPETLRRVREAMEEHGYVYNAVAGDLSRRKSSVLGLFLPTTESPKISTTSIALQDVANSHGFPVIINNTLFDPRLERDLLRQCRERSLAGLIFVGCMMENEEAIFGLGGEMPCLFLWDSLAETDCNYIGIDNFAASREMGGYLLGLGHRRIAFVGALPMQVRRIHKRLEGFLNAMREGGGHTPDEYVLEYAPTLENGRLAMRRLLALASPPTAVFCACDTLAIGALTACREAGLSVPCDISIAGFDDMDFASHAFPPLTTVRVPAREMGDAAGHAMLAMLRTDGATSVRRVLPTSIIVRETCAPI